MTPSCKRRFRNCNEFGLCVNIGQNGYVLAEDVETFESIFLYVVKGNGKIGKMFKTDYLDLNEGKFYDIKDYENDDVIFKSDEEFYLIGFNNINQDSWEGRLLKSDETIDGEIFILEISSKSGSQLRISAKKKIRTKNRTYNFFCILQIG